MGRLSGPVFGVELGHLEPYIVITISLVFTIIIMQCTIMAHLNEKWFNFHAVDVRLLSNGSNDDQWYEDKN